MVVFCREFSAREKSSGNRRKSQPRLFHFGNGYIYFLRDEKLGWVETAPSGYVNQPIIFHTSSI